MRCTLLVFAASVAALVAGYDNAASVYQCVDSRGAIGFQDQPCARGQAEHVIDLPNPATAPVAVAPRVDAVDTPPQMTPPSPVAAPMIAPPDFFLCTRHDGSRYTNVDGRGGSTAVPVGALGMPERDLASAYGGRGGIGISAPGVRPIPQIPARNAPLAGGYVWIDDECQHAGAQEACAFLRSELSNVQDQLKRAFSDTEAQLKQRQSALRDRMRGC